MNSYATDYRNAAINMVKQGMSFVAVARLLGCHRKTVAEWWRNRDAPDDGSDKDPPTPSGPKPKIDKRGRKIIRQLVAEDGTITLRELVEKLADHNYKVSVSTVSRELIKMGLTQKKGRRVRVSSRAPM